MRSRVTDALTAALPEGKYQIVGNISTVDRLARPLVQVELSAFEPGPVAGVRALAFTIHTATHHVGVTAQAEDAADEIAHEVWSALETITWLNPSRAEKVTYKGQHLGYDITTEALTRKDTPS